MEVIVGVLLLVNVLVGGVLLADYIDRTGGTMEERKAVVFEVYRYAVCFVMLLAFSLTAFQLIGALVSQAGGSNPEALAGPGIGVLLSGVLFVIHWLMKNPASPAQTPPAS